MYFTQEDYKKIENWLSKKSVKDSDFQEALPLNGKEIITVVQSGHNKKVNIREFIDKIYKYNGSDFTNITNIYKVENITLEEAINFIPIVNRKKGQVITFLNTDGNWEIYQFIGELNQWNNLNFWNNPFDLGVLDYADLVNKPSINGKELNGNTSLKDLGIQPAGDYITESLVNTKLDNYATKTFVSSNYAGKSALNNHIADSVKHITAAERTAWNNKSDLTAEDVKKIKVNNAGHADSADNATKAGSADKLTNSRKIFGLPFDGTKDVVGGITADGDSVINGNLNVTKDGIFGGEVVAVAGEGTPTGVTDYSALTGKPSINGKELVSGENSLTELGIQPAGNYADKDTVTDVLNSITNINNNLSTINEDIDGINTNIGTINDSITGINNDILGINNNLNTHINDVSKFETLFKKFFEYDERNNAIKAKLDFYTDTDKSLSAGGLNNNIGEIAVISSYSELKDKPFINGQELISGDNSLDKLGIQPKGNYTTNEFVEGLTNAIMEKLNLHIKDFEDFIKKLNTYFEYDSDHQAIKVLLDLYTVTGKNISAGGYNNSGTEITVPKSYGELTEKPQINGQELLSGDNSLDKLGIQPKGNYATNEIVESQISAIIEKLNTHIADFESFVNELNTYFEFDSKNQAIKVLYDLYTDKGKNISASGYNNSGTEITIPKSYIELTDKPTINGIEIVGNLTSKDLGLQLEGDYLTISDILNTIKQEDGTTKQYIKSELLPEVKGGNGIEILQTLSKTNISLLVDTNTFSFGENNELQINKIDGGIF